LYAKKDLRAAFWPLARLSFIMKYILLVLAMSACAWAQIASGAGDIGKGTAKGVGNVAKGTAKGAADLVTLHPINAAASVGKGAGRAGRNVGVGTVKGTGKIGKGIGKAFKKLF
jgi:hypothetical protein